MEDREIVDPELFAPATNNVTILPSKTGNSTKVFLAAPNGLASSECKSLICNALNAENYELSQLAHCNENNIVPQLLASMRLADVVVVLLGRESENVYIEAGLAIGSGKPVVLIAPSASELVMLSGYPNTLLFNDSENGEEFQKQLLAMIRHLSKFD